MLFVLCVQLTHRYIADFNGLSQVKRISVDHPKTYQK